MLLMAGDTEELRRQAEDRQKQAEERNRRTTFEEFIRACHNLLSLPIEPAAALQLRSQFLHASAEDAPRLFLPVIALEEIGRLLSRRLLSSEKDVESYERHAVEEHVHDIPEAQKEFALGDGVQFDNHANALDDIYSAVPDVEDPSSFRRPKPDQFCIHRVNSNTKTLLTPTTPQALGGASSRGPSADAFLEGKIEVLGRTADRVGSGSAIPCGIVMVHECLEYSYITNGLATLYYYLCEPNMEVDLADDQSLELPRTSIARVLCLCLMSFLSPLHIWETDLDYVRAHISADELRKTPQISESSESSESQSPTTDDRRPNTRSQTGCRPEETMHRSKPDDESDPNLNQTTSGRKRALNQITPSPPPTQRWSRIGSQSDRRGSGQHHTAKFCTQRCLLGLQHTGILDSHCPNVELHRQGRDNDRHLISTERLVQLLSSSWMKT
ncbi:hypothetical protein V1515DRAFT_612850 [Lipomyces mesembrius]